MAVNRLGEQYLIIQDGTVAQMLKDSRFWVVAAHDMSLDVADARRFKQITSVGGMLVWLLMILVAWQVTRHALRSMHEITQRAERIVPSPLGERLPRDSAQRVHLELGASNEPLLAKGHRRLIGVLLGNLLDNALRYSRSSSPVRVRISRNCDMVCVDVEDEGSGIPEEQRTLAFNRFHRLEQSHSKHTRGVGLGLSIARAIAEVHGTTVALSGGSKAGTVASFRLPAFSGDPQERLTFSVGQVIRGRPSAWSMPGRWRCS